MTLKYEKNYMSGDLNYETSVKGNKLVIHTLHSLSSKGFYFTWSLEKCGFGEFSIGKSSKTNTWRVDNETMSLKTCSVFVKALEEGLKKQNNAQINYFLQKIKNEVSKDCESLEDALKMIWLEGTKADQEFERKRNPHFEEEVLLGDLNIMSSEFQELKSKKVEMVGYSFFMEYDLIGKHFGELYLYVEKHNNKKDFIVSENLTKEKLKEVTDFIEKLDLSKVDNFYNNKQMKYLCEIKNNWEQFKKMFVEVSGLKEVSDIFDHPKVKKTAYQQISK